MALTSLLRLAAGAFLLFPAIGAACPAPSPQILFHSCWGEARAASVLLPEEDGLVEPLGERAGTSLIITGGYTGKDRRAEERPNPVGLFIHKGEVVNPTLARMDGIAILSPGGELQVQHRGATAFGGETYDLGDLAHRRAFQRMAASTGASVFQSHLLVVDGALDIREREGAPLAIRRLLFTDADGYGIYQSRRAMTLFEAARQVHEEVAPRMALNLDMGSFDYCLLFDAGSARNCGVLARGETRKLSNLLILSLEPQSGSL